MSKWISVKDRLPDNGVDVLISYGNTPFYHLAFLTHNGDIKWFTGSHSNVEYSLDYVTHWMPLPKPPEEKYQFTGRTVLIFEKPEDK